jgi:3',5'-cyclic AMP phosphodiesterase CpdA
MHIERMLKTATQAKPAWLLVAGHYAVFSRGSHGDISELKTNLLPLLKKYNVHAYFCGHDHLSEVSFTQLHDLLELRI